MKSLKLKRKIKRIWKKSAKRLGFCVLKKTAVVVLMVGLNFYWLSLVGQTNSYFSDTETGQVTVSAGIWMPELLSPRDGAIINGSYVEQRWTPINDATKYIYQSCNNNPDIDGSCNLRWYEEYGPGTPQFAAAKKWANNIANTTYWWRVKVQIGAFTSQWTPAWKIVIDNSHLNKVVINEFLPNPVGYDDDPMPGGEWVELYNNTGSDVSVAGWYLYDNDNSQMLAITSANTNTGGTTVTSGGFLVVYRDGDSDFALNNTGGDTVRLYNKRISAGGNLIDSHAYTIDAPAGKSFVRFPDGSNTWVDPLPTPGEPNILDDSNFALIASVSEPDEPSEHDDILPKQLPADEELFVPQQEIIAGVVSGSMEIIRDFINPNQTASGSQEIVVASGSFEIVASPSEGQSEITNPAPVASGSVEPLVEPLPEPLPETLPEVLLPPDVSPAPESADNPQPATGDESFIQVPAEPAIPAEPVTVEAPTEPVPPPADPPLPTSPSENLGGQAAPVDSTSSPQAE